MSFYRLVHRIALRAFLPTAILVMLGLGVFLVVGASPKPSLLSNDAKAPKPTVVLVHRVPGEASTWEGVAQRMRNDRYQVIAPAKPLRGLSSDAAYTSSALDRTDHSGQPLVWRCRHLIKNLKWVVCH